MICFASKTRAYCLLCRHRSSSKLSPDELAAQSKTIWPTPTIILLFSPQFKLITDEYLQQTFEVYGVIARGAFGTVYRVIRRNDRTDCALKVLEKSQVNRLIRFKSIPCPIWQQVCIVIEIFVHFYMVFR